MKYPIMRGGTCGRVEVSGFNGGVDLAGAVTQVGDNQLIQCENMWWKNGALRTRPGTWFGLDDIHRRYAEPAVEKYHITDQAGDLRFETYVAGDGYSRLRALRVGSGGGIHTGVELKSLSAMLVPDSGYSVAGEPTYPYMVFQHEGADTYSGRNKIFVQPGGDVDAQWLRVEPRNYYIPTVLVNATPVASLSVRKRTGVWFEGYNLLSSEFFSKFTTDGDGVVYTLPEAVEGSVYFDLVLSDGQRKTFSMSGAIVNPVTGEEKYEAQSLQVFLNRNKGYFIARCLEDGVYVPLADGGVRNNLVVKAVLKRWNQAPPLDALFKMTINTWFGGDRGGYNSGTRLFVAGNPDFPNLVRWSEANNPLYFPENNYAYIGNAASPVTAFAKQGDKLIIFKGNEMYYATHVAGRMFYAEDVLEGRVTDVAAVSTTFPITPIHASIGCDLPGTIRVCANRLVWAASNRRVYVLLGTNQYGESNVYIISGGIESELSRISDSDIAAAYACEYDDRYVLFAGVKAFLFDERDSRFVNYNGGEWGVPWYVWDFSGADGKPAGVTAFGDSTRISLYMRDGNHNRFTYARLEGKCDGLLVLSLIKETPIDCSFTTKAFDGAVPEKYKDFQRVYIGIGNEGEYDAGISYVTECGEVFDMPVRPLRADASEQSAAYGIMCRLTPSVRRALRMAIHVIGRGALVVRELVVEYAVNGRGCR